jgi:hypothetical protein
MGVVSSVSWSGPGFGCGVPVPGTVEVAVVPVSNDEESWTMLCAVPHPERGIGVAVLRESALPREAFAA